MPTLTIPGKPIAKARPRFFVRKKKDGSIFRGVYPGQETEEGRFMLEAKSQLSGHKIITGPISLVTIFYFPRPKNHYGTGRNAGKLKDWAPKHHIVKPDKDNCEKFVMDCLNGLAWKDDCQVCNGTQQKWYSDNPRTEICVVEIK